MTLFGDPTTNAYARFRPYSFAPDRIGWAVDNRGALIRIQGGPGDASTHVENRMSEPAANPYLWLAANIAAGLDGIERGATPPPPIVGDPYAEENDLLPQSLGEAADELDASKLYREAVRRPARRLHGDDEARRGGALRRGAAPIRPRAATGRCASTSRSTDVPPARARRPAAPDRRGGGRRRRSRLVRRPVAAPPRRLGHGVVARRRGGGRFRPARAHAVGRRGPRGSGVPRRRPTASRAAVALVHLRGATPGLTFEVENCHPFVHDRAAFAQNGALYPQDRLHQLLPPDVEATVDGIDRQRAAVPPLPHSSSRRAAARSRPSCATRSPRCCRRTPRPC